MMPRRRSGLDDGDGLHVLVPGIMGIGFLISLAMLALDAVERALPMVGRRRAAEMARLSEGRSNDLRSISHGRPPEVGVVRREARSRLASLLLGAGALGGAVLAIRIGFDVAGETSSDRQAWAAVIGLLVGMALAAPGTMWLLAAVTGPKAPGWLRWFHQFWPLGGLPDLSTDPGARSKT